MKKKLNKHSLVLAFCFVTACLVCGCKKNDEAPKPNPQAPAPAQPTAQVKPSAAVQKPVSTSQVGGQATGAFIFKSKKDPFKPLIIAPEAAAVKAPVPSRTRIVDALPIQSHEVSKFIVTGIITGLKENKALLIDPTGKGYVVKTGMLIGDNGGRITRITASSLEVTEQYLDGKKRIKNRKIVLPLAKKSKEISR